MIIKVSNSSDSFWLPFYALNDRILDSPGFMAFGCIQIILYCCTAYVIIRTCSIFLHIKVFHENLNFLMAWFLFQWFEAILAKLVIIPYEIGLVMIGDDPKRTYYCWWTDELEEMVIVKSRADIMPLYVACLFLWHYMYSAIFAIVTVGVERVFATYYIQDYESVHRRHIPFILIVVTNFVTVPYAYYITNNKIPFMVAYAQCLINAAFVFFGYLAIWRVNLYMRDRLNRDTQNDEYTLAKKFQIEENIRSLLLSKRLVLSAVIYLTFSLIILILLVFRMLSGYEVYFVHILDNVILLAALVISVTLLFCSPAWKERFISRLPIVKNFRSSRVSHFNFTPKVPEKPESEVYFAQLKNAWV